tara:strand:- start:176 stop:460 length:285 start_codon:yes stop_codon:yes gene_type:complete
MPIFHIERIAPGLGSTPPEELEKGVQNSEAVLVEMRSEGKNIRQIRSFANMDGIFCIYEAESEDLIREHAERSGGTADKITEITEEIQHDTSEQ